MNIRQVIAVLASALLTISALTISGGAFAEDIYKWVDADGNVHYEDRPSGARSEERLQISYKRTNSDAVQQRVESRLESATAKREAKATAAEEQQSAAEKRAEAEQRVAKCEEYRGKMKVMADSRRLYREDEDGERVYLDDAGREAATQQAQSLVDEYCSN